MLSTMTEDSSQERTERDVMVGGRGGGRGRGKGCALYWLLAEQPENLPCRFTYIYIYIYIVCVWFGWRSSQIPPFSSFQHTSLESNQCSRHFLPPCLPFLGSSLTMTTYAPYFPFLSPVSAGALASLSMGDLSGSP